jgi:hypothetical protein
VAAQPGLHAIGALWALYLAVGTLWALWAASVISQARACGCPKPVGPWKLYGERVGTLRTLLVVLIVIVGIAAIAVGAVYLTTPAHSLPSFFPGHSAKSVLKHSKRGVAGVGFGIVLLIVAFGMALSDVRRRRHRRRAQW